MIKPDGVARGLSDAIKERIANEGLKIIKSKKFIMDIEKAKKLYDVHNGKTFYNGLINFITSGPVEAMVVEGDNAIVLLRKIMGATDPRKAEKGTIRGDHVEENIFTKDGVMKNLIHGSDSTDSAKYEIPIFF